jgi:hypothetical protein
MPATGFSSSVGLFSCAHFALDICNIQSPVFAGFSAMLQNLPFMEQAQTKLDCVSNFAVFEPI